MGIGVWGSGCGAWGLGFGVWDVGMGFWVLGSRVEGLGHSPHLPQPHATRGVDAPPPDAKLHSWFGVEFFCLGFRVSGLGFSDQS